MEIRARPHRRASAELFTGWTRKDLRYPRRRRSWLRGKREAYRRGQLRVRRRSRTPPGGPGQVATTMPRRHRHAQRAAHRFGGSERRPAVGPPRSALAGPTSLTLDGLHGFDDERIHVVIPAGDRRPSMHGLVVHESTELSDADVHPSQEPRRTRSARSVVDLASWSTSDRYARAVVIAAFQQGLVNTAGIRDALSRRGPCRRRGLIVESILDASGGIQSLPERDFDDLRRLIGLPPPSRQRRIRGRDGRYYLDASWGPSVCRSRSTTSLTQQCTNGTPISFAPTRSSSVGSACWRSRRTRSGTSLEQSPTN
jgi:hypothetical protein